MIGLIDPALLIPRSGANAATETRLDLEFVINTCRQHSIRLVALDAYWNDLWLKLGAPLESTLDPQSKRALQLLRKLGSPPARIQQIPSTTRVWRLGFTQLFRGISSNFNWEETMAHAAIQAAMQDQEVVVFTRRIEGRNLIVHKTENSTLHENTRWILHIQPSSIGHRQIPCIHHPRNITSRWTTRFDWRLPAISDSARYPFHPPEQWWHPNIQAWRAINALPAWIDNKGNGWCRPNVMSGLGYHWDVTINSQTTKASIGANYLNIVEYGAPIKEKKCGDIHHIPEALRGRINDTGW